MHWTHFSSTPHHISKFCKIKNNLFLSKNDGRQKLLRTEDNDWWISLKKNWGPVPGNWADRPRAIEKAWAITIQPENSPPLQISPLRGPSDSYETFYFWYPIHLSESFHLKIQDSFPFKFWNNTSLLKQRSCLFADCNVDSPSAGGAVVNIINPLFDLAT